MGAQESSMNRVVVQAYQAAYAGGVDPLESIHGFLKSLKLPALLAAGCVRAELEFLYF
jgi:hypothetical protein